MKKFLKILFLFCFLLSVTLGACIIYAFNIEPYRIKINEFFLNEPLEAAKMVTIVQISDIHIKKDFTYENLNKVIDLINKQEADIVVFSGDLYDNYANYHDDENISSALLNIEAAYAKIAVWGNRDYGGGAVRHYEAIMQRAGFDILRNENRVIRLKNGRKLLFTGLDDGMLGDPELSESSVFYPADYAILLMHEPDLAAEYSDYGYDIMLSGHSHGGQINIPFLSSVNDTAVAVTALSSLYSSGMYEMENSTSKLYVNTGIGTTHISARFGVIPEIAVFHVYL